jgi:predicted regulator of Ras-like GTPase activity (Roadblock/LC7/MglB family)
MADLKSILLNLSNVDGVRQAIVVGRDGFVIDFAARTASSSVDAVGAVVSTGIGSAEVIGREIGVGGVTQSLIEYEDGFIVMSFIGTEAILAVVAESSANVGMVRHAVKKSKPEIEQVI